jgi:NAD-dependent SIR2 family protein deacetylase
MKELQGGVAPAPAPQDLLIAFIRQHPRLAVLTGAGISTESGIPDYRDREGAWKRPPPVEFGPFMGQPAVRQRYWARSMVGWSHFSLARPNRAHAALVALETAGHVMRLITQNVDGLHTAAGSRHVIDLHGRLDLVRCMDCEHRLPRAELQQELESRNPDWLGLPAPAGPDGDVDLEGADFSAFRVADCPVCGGILKPDVVFFGEAVPRDRVLAAFEAVQAADALLVVGSSLMVYSGFRFAEHAAAAGKPIAAINLGRTRADHLLSLKLEGSCSAILNPAVAQIMSPKAG